MHRPHILAPALLLLAAAGALAQEDNQGFFTVRQILEVSCSSCHDWAGSYEGITDPSRVSPGSPEDSRLYQMVASDAMPLGGSPLPVTQKNLLRAWIAAGASSSEEPLVTALPEAGGEVDAVTAATTPAPRGARRLKFHKVSGYTSGSLFLAAGAVGAVQWGTLISAAHAYRDAHGIEEGQISAQCAGYIQGLWGDAEHQALRWTHVGLLSAAEALYLYNAVTGSGMRTRDGPGLTAQDLHRYAFFLHGGLMLAQIILGVFTTEVLSSGNHEAMLAVGIAHTAIGFTIPLVMIGSGIAVRRMLKL